MRLLVSHIFDKGFVHSKPCQLEVHHEPQDSLHHSTRGGQSNNGADGNREEQPRSGCSLVCRGDYGLQRNESSALGDSCTDTSSGRVSLRY